MTNSPEPDPALSAKIARHVFMITGSICLVIAIFAELVIRILYSSEFVPAASPLRWLLPAIFILSGPKVLVAEILARKKVAATVWMSAGAAVINVAANFALVPRWGITGSAIASSISYSFLAVGLTWLFLRVSGLSWSCMLPRRSDFNIYTRYLRLRWPRLTGAPVPKD